MTASGPLSTPPPRAFWARRDFVAFALTFVAVLGVYVWSLPPSVTLEDAGEFAVAADWMGVPHPPGYPLWTFFAWFFQWIFHAVHFRGHPNPAWGVAFCSAFFGALACGLLAMLLCKSLRMISEGLAPGRSRLSIFAPAWGIGLGTGLLLALLVHATPDIGTNLLQWLLPGFALITLLRCLPPTEKLAPWRFRFLPAPENFGPIFMGACVSGTAYFFAWSHVTVPSPVLVLPLALVFTLAAMGLCALGDTLLALTARKEGLARAVRAAGLDVLCAMGGGLLLAFTPLMWSQSVMIEVYSLNAFFIALIMLLVFDYIHRPYDRTLYLIAFLFALGLTNHQALLFLVFFLIAGVAASGRKTILKAGLFLGGLFICLFLTYKARQYARIDDPEAMNFFLRYSALALVFSLVVIFSPGKTLPGLRKMLMILFLGGFGLGFHLFMPIASEQNPPMNWGYARTTQGFLRAVTRGQYARFEVADNFREIGHRMSMKPTVDMLEAGNERELLDQHRRRTLFIRQLGAYFHDPAWKTSIASQFSWQFPRHPPDPEGREPPPPERNIPLALLGLLPLLCFHRLDARSRAWFQCTLIAMFFLTVVFLIIQWPELNHNDLFVKRVQYVQAHVFYALWMAMGGFFLILWVYAILPKTMTLRVGGISLALLFLVFPIHKDARDPRHLEFVGSSKQRGHDFGWRFGNHILRGMNGILLDELYLHDDPKARLTPWAITQLRARNLPDETLDLALTLSEEKPLSRRDFRRGVLDQLPDLTDTHRRQVEEYAMLGAFRALSREEQTAALRGLHRLPPDLDYPPELAQKAILFGGTDPGRFVPTYMLFSAHMRPDVFLLTQNALADSTYLDSMRDLYGDDIFIPSALDSSLAFRAYAHHLRIWNPVDFAALMESGDNLAVRGVDQVNFINFHLARKIAERNQHDHAVYVEESYPIPWMMPRLRPHGLVLKLESEPVRLTNEDMQRDREFWTWYKETLLETHLPVSERRQSFHRDLMARKIFSKLRGNIAGVYAEQGWYPEAEAAYLQAERLFPRSPEVSDRLARMYEGQLRFDEAAAVVTRYAAFDPTSSWLRHYSRRLAQLRTVHERLKATEEAWDERPGANLTLDLVHLYGELDLIQPMEDAVNLLLGIEGLDPAFYPVIAALMREFQNRDYYQRALIAWARSQPEEIRPVLDLAAMALSDEDFQQTFDYLLEALRRDRFATQNRLREDPRFTDISRWQQFQQLLR
ncbi:MAG: DUF2723 domain-containing protein [Verrucomicrobia bacterium]|nr:DUF2723 domain-containing protein [Verrucomicrobiota bacterium]MCH8512113.1 DUF2723 domain-containing protein [Kiritimatiellia bacterium]